MIKQFLENWGLVTFIIAALIALGKMIQMIMSIEKWRLSVDSRLNPENPQSVIVTVGMCDKCRMDCERRNIAQFLEIKNLLTDIYNKRDDYVAALGDVSCRLGRIEGKLT